MGIDAGIASSTSEVLVFSVRDVLFCSGIPVLLGQAEVNDEQLHSEGEGEEKWGGRRDGEEGEMGGGGKEVGKLHESVRRGGDEGT